MGFVTTLFRRGWALILCAGLGDAPAGVFAQETITWPQLALVKQHEGFLSPVQITHANDGGNRLFIVEQKGVIRLRKNGLFLDTPFLDIQERVRKIDEQGLLGIAFPPDYATKQYFYVDYSNTAGKTIIARFRVTENPDVADPGSEEVILTLDQPTGDHNGGQLAFGPDGYLYISVGDGGPDADPNNRAQDLSTHLGKILRVDVESGASPYAVPATNPYKDRPGAYPLIWALGFRNPWRMSFDRQTGDLYIGDVGDGAYEEVNFQPAPSSGGENYGWRCTEGAHEFHTYLSECIGRTLTFPISEFAHTEGCAVIGGYVYRGALYPRLQGFYLYADFCTGRIWGLKSANNEWQKQLLLETGFPIVSFGEDDDGELYLVAYDGVLYRIADAQTAATAELTGQWQRLVQTCAPRDGGSRCLLRGMLPVRNQGPRRTPQSFLTTFYLSEDGVLDANDTVLAQLRSGPLRSARAIRLIWRTLLPVGNSATGRFIFAVIDSGNAIAEINEGDNTVRFGPVP